MPFFLKRELEKAMETARPCLEPESLHAGLRQSRSIPSARPASPMLPSTEPGGTVEVPCTVLLDEAVEQFTPDDVAPIATTVDRVTPSWPKSTSRGRCGAD